MKKTKELLEKYQNIANLVVLQSTPFCNINCKYCFLPDRHLAKSMSLQTVAQIARVIFETRNISKNITITWHSGEPLVVRPDFYRAAHSIIEAAKPSDIDISYNFQTNATLIDKAWCEFFKSRTISVTASIDGPKFIHDKHRVDRNNKGPFDQVIHGIKLLRENDVEVSVIAVITKDSLDHPNEIFEFFNELGIHKVGFNLEQIGGANTKTSVGSEVRQKVSEFFKTGINFMEKLSTFDIRDISNTIIELYAKGDLIRQDNVPLQIISFDYQGNVSTFSPELLSNKHSKYGDFIFGNVKTMSNLSDILSDEKFLRIYNDILLGVDACKSRCEYFITCRGGAPFNKLYETGTFNSDVTVNCILKEQTVSEVVLEHIENNHLLRNN